MAESPSPKRAARGLLAKVSGALSRSEPSLDPRVAAAGVRVLAQAERLLDRLDGVTRTLQKVADVELKVIERMVPIVEDLGELVRHTLDEARERRGLPPRPPRRADAEPLVIDHEPADGDADGHPRS